MHVIARVRNDFPTKFGLPRQSGLVPQMLSTIVFEKEYRVPEALRGLEGFSHLWLIWGFHKAQKDGWSPTVRPPRLGGNTRMGVFATRSPFRPNPIGLSVVKLEKIVRDSENGTVLVVSGADMMDGTPVYDIKPYIPYADCHPEAVGGFTQTTEKRRVDVVIPSGLTQMLPPEKMDALMGILREDPRPAYQEDPERVYGFAYAGFNVRFRVSEGVLTVTDITREEST
ncbi:MAG: tRNA (N6-threonylcarbamoyladenosine(37)-N6)-methyltransferase TrmO [Clostridiales bacterium]|nr:tRNA (N6-threonylcarbamoyladenosine(37)-N6)-methyltransferase TrmO [Clostridiales bacterium]